MLDLHYWPTPNGKKVTIQLEECGLDYNVIECNIGKGDQFTDEFLKINPNNRMPALVDHHGMNPAIGWVGVFAIYPLLNALLSKEIAFPLCAIFLVYIHICQYARKGHL